MRDAGSEPWVSWWEAEQEGAVFPARCPRAPRHGDLQVLLEGRSRVLGVWAEAVVLAVEREEGSRGRRSLHSAVEAWTLEGLTRRWSAPGLDLWPDAWVGSTPAAVARSGVLYADGARLMALERATGQARCLIELSGRLRGLAASRDLALVGVQADAGIDAALIEVEVAPARVRWRQPSPAPSGEVPAWRPWSRREAWRPGEWLLHDEHGPGQVQELLTPTRMLVSFAEGARTLECRCFGEPGVEPGCAVPTWGPPRSYTSARFAGDIAALTYSDGRSASYKNKAGGEAFERRRLVDGAELLTPGVARFEAGTGRIVGYTLGPTDDQTVVLHPYGWNDASALGLHAATGALRWQLVLPERYLDVGALAPEAFIALTRSGRRCWLEAFERADGRPRWSAPIEGGVGASGEELPVALSLTADAAVAAWRGERGALVVCAVELASGRELWRRVGLGVSADEGRRVVGAPQLVATEEGLLVFAQIEQRRVRRSVVIPLRDR